MRYVSIIIVVFTILLTALVLSPRNVNVQLQVDAVHDCHVVQYERKLLSLEERKRRPRHLTYRSAARKKKMGRADVLCLSLGNCFFQRNREECS